MLGTSGCTLVNLHTRSSAHKLFHARVVPPLSSQQYGAGTASLNVAVAASIILHHFAHWAGYPERQREVRSALTWHLSCASVVSLRRSRSSVCAVWDIGSGGKPSYRLAAAVFACEWCACSG